ncbi:MAG: hypothetical protein E6248_00780 [Clostridium sp.]|uniref:hypothetical protein n=1 Tax=Clostridium sp. TaxID=1506 RepID=UPI002906D830|nr:hypothetical protein [Clostridium sp.]MDU5108952.1 hypothetical protein [Clostridium sp.]
MGFGKIFERGLQGAELGGLIGAAFTTVAATTTLFVTGPIGMAALAATATASAVSGTAIGTGIGGGVGAAFGAAEEYMESKN